MVQRVKNDRNSEIFEEKRKGGENDEGGEV